MRRGAFVVASWAVASALLHCSLVTDTSGLSGGPTTGDGAAPPTDGPNDGATDGSTPIPEGGAAAIGPLWLAYGTIGGKVGVRRWLDDAGMWSAELPGPDLGGSSVRWVVPKETPLGSYLAIGRFGTAGGYLDLFEHTADGKWNLGFSVPMSVATTRAFDIEYETTTKALLVVYGDSTGIPKYRRRTAAGWSGEGVAPPVGTLPPVWIELARNPLRNEVALAIDDRGSNLGVDLWDGTAWGADQELESLVNSEDFKCFDIAYGNENATLLAVWGYSGGGDGGGSTPQAMRFASRPIDGAFGAVTLANDGLPPGPLVLAPEVGTSRIALSYLEYNCNKGDSGCDDFVTGIWTGGSFIANGSRDPNTTTLYHGRLSTMPTGVAWLGTTGVAIAAYHRDLAADVGLLPFTRFASGAWGAVSGAQTAPALPRRASMQLVSAPGPTVVAVIEDTDGTLWSKGYREPGGNSAWSDVGGGAPLATSLVVAGGVPFGVTSP